MSSATSALDSEALLRRRIGWLCQTIRLIVAAYAVWVLWLVFSFWGNGAWIVQIYSGLHQMPVLPLEAWQRIAGLCISLTTWSITAVACWCAWRLFSTYLKGQIFSVDAALWLRRVGIFGLSAMGLDIVTRPLVSALVTWHMPAGHRVLGINLNPHDLLTIMFLVSLVALAHIFKAAAEIADENAQIV